MNREGEKATLKVRNDFSKKNMEALIKFSFVLSYCLEYIFVTVRVTKYFLMDNLIISDYFLLHSYLG